MDEKYIEKQAEHIKNLLPLLERGQSIVIKRVDDELEIEITEDFI